MLLCEPIAFAFASLLESDPRISERTNDTHEDVMAELRIVMDLSLREFLMKRTATGEYCSRRSNLEDLLPFFRIDFTELCDKESIFFFARKE